MTPGLASNDRNVVCVIGDPSPQLCAALASRDLEAKKCTLDEAIALCAHAGRALVLPPKDVKEVAKALNHALKPILNSGAAFFAAREPHEKFAMIETLFSPDALARRLSIRADEASLLPARVLAGQSNWEITMAQECSRHDPGRSSPSGCKITWTKQTIRSRKIPGKEDLILIGRAFNDCSHVELDYLTGGQSRARGPWVVSAQRTDGRPPVKFVVKTGSVKRIKEETDNMRDHCFYHIPFAHYPPVIADRCMLGSSRRALVSMFVDNAIPFEEYIRNHSPRLAVLAIFDGPLRLWRSGGKMRPQALGSIFEDRHVIPSKSNALNKVYEIARMAKETALAPSDLLGRLKGYPRVEVHDAFSHGDLHLRNILVRQNSTDVILIDFSKSGEAPASYDPAVLDVSLAMDIPEKDLKESGVTEDTCFDLYNPPLIQYRPTGAVSNRLIAIEQLRRQISNIVTEEEYEIAIAACLIWHAWRRNNAVAYRCASRIIGGLQTSP